MGKHRYVVDASRVLWWVMMVESDASMAESDVHLPFGGCGQHRRLLPWGMMTDRLLFLRRPYPSHRPSSGKKALLFRGPYVSR